MAKRESQARAFRLKARELRKMILAHADSVQRGIDQVQEAMEALPTEVHVDPMAKIEGFTPTQKREVYGLTIANLAVRRDEARYLAAHVQTVEVTGAELIAFKRSFGEITVDVDALAFAPEAAPAPQTQPERNMADALISVPRMRLPPGVLERGR